MASSSTTSAKAPAEAAPSSPWRLSQSPFPAFSLASLLFGSVITPTKLHARTFTPPFILRAAFSIPIAGAGYIIGQGDVYNGSGVATAWSMTYLIAEQFAMGMEKINRLPRSGLSLLLAGAAATTATLYGTEHFVYSTSPDESEP